MFEHSFLLACSVLLKKCVTKDGGGFDHANLAVLVLKTLYHKLGVACDAAIAYLLSVPFDLEGLECAMDKLKG